MNDSLVDAAEVKLEAGGENGAAFQLKDITDGRLKLQLELTDDLAIDNVAFAGLDPPRQLQVVVVTAANKRSKPPCRLRKSSRWPPFRSWHLKPWSRRRVYNLPSPGKVDLFIYDRCAPKEMPPRTRCFMGAIPPVEGWSASAPVSPIFIIDTNRAHPIMQYVDMTSVQIVEGTTLKAPTDATTLLRSDAGVLMALAPRLSYQDAVLA